MTGDVIGRDPDVVGGGPAGRQPATPRAAL